MRWIKRLLIALLISPFALLAWHFYDTYEDIVGVGHGAYSSYQGENIYAADRYTFFRLHPLILYHLGGMGVAGASRNSLIVRHNLLPFGVNRVSDQLRISRYPPIRFKDPLDDYDYNHPIHAFIRCGGYAIPGDRWEKYTIEGKEISAIVARYCPVTRLSSTPLVFGDFPADVTAALERAIGSPVSRPSPAR